VEIGPESFLVGRSIVESRVGTVTRATIVGAIRNGELIVGLRPSFVFEPGDLVAIVGAKSARRNFQNLAEIKIGG